MLMHSTDWPRTNQPYVRYECANVCTSQKIKKILSTKFLLGHLRTTTLINIYHLESMLYSVHRHLSLNITSITRYSIKYVI